MFGWSKKMPWDYEQVIALFKIIKGWPLGQNDKVYVKDVQHRETLKSNYLLLLTTKALFA